MRLKTKTLLTVGIILAGLIGVMNVISSTILLGSLAKAEKKNTYQTVTGVLNVIEQTTHNLSTRFSDWSAWDDAYTFIQDHNQRFLESNLISSQFAKLNVNLVLYIDDSAHIVYGTAFDLINNKLLSVPSELRKQLSINSLLLAHPNPTSHQEGIILINQKPMLITSQPIVTSESKGPIRGSAIFGRYLDAQKIKELSKITRLNLALYGLNDPAMPKDFKPARDNLSLTNPIWVNPINEETMAGYTLLMDIYGKPAAVLRVDVPREISQQAKTSQFYLLASLLIAGLIFGGVTLLLLERLILSRLAILSKDVKNIGDSGDLSLRVLVSGKDELSSLGDTINWMLTSLERSLKELQAEREKSERLLLNVLPSAIADRLKEDESTIADSFPEATVLFADIVGFTKMSGVTSPAKLVHVLNKIFSVFDRLAEKHGLEKIKTIGDAYMVVGGIPIKRADHAQAVADMAIDMQKAILEFNRENDTHINIRIGINTGPVVAGVIGTKKFIYDLWGDAVNIASRMESHGIPGHIQVSESTYQLLKENYLLADRGVIEIKGKGKMMTYILVRRRVATLVV